MTVDFLYRIILYAVSKNKQQGYVSPADFNLVINQGSKSFQTYLVGEFQQYMPGRPVPRVGYGQNQRVRQRLTPTIYGFILNVDGTGFSPYPGDYEETDAMWSLYGVNRIRFCSQDKFYSLYNSRIDPYQTNPFYLIEDEGFRLYPNNINQTRLSYIRTVPEIVWAYTLDGNNRPVYDPANSIDPVWSDLDCLEVAVRALRLVGVNLQAADVSAYAETIKNQGQ